MLLYFLFSMVVLGGLGFFKINTKVRYVSRPFKIIKCCKYYILEDNLEVVAFDKRFSDPKLRWVLRRRYNYTKRFLKAMAERIGNKSNLIIVIYGTPNSGKSEGGQTVAFFIKYCFWKYRVFIANNLFMAFSTADFQTILTEMKPGDIGIRDESSKLSGIGSKNVQKYLDNITKIIRKSQNSFVFIDPTLIEPDVVSFYLETAGKRSFHKCKKCKRKYINLKKDTNRICPYCKDDLEPMYPYCKIRFILYDKNHDYLGHIYLPLHMSKRFRNKYKIKKDLNIKSLMANAGMVTPEIDIRRLDRDTEILTKLCLEYGVTKERQMHPLVTVYNAKQSNDKDRIKGDTNYMNVLYTYVFLLFKKGITIQKAKRKEELSTNIKFKDGDDFSDFCLRNIDDENMARVAQGIARGDGYRTMELNYPKKKFPKMTYHHIRKTSIYLRSVNSENNIGFMFEKWYALSIGVPKGQLGKILGGSSDRPDLIWKDVIYSLKFRLDSKASSLKFQQSTSLGPEYRYAKKNNKKYKLVFMNPAWSMKIHIIEIDPIEDPEEIIVRKYDLNP